VTDSRSSVHGRNFLNSVFRVEDIALTAVAPIQPAAYLESGDFRSHSITGNGTNLSLDGAIAIAEGGKESLSVDGRLNLRVLNGFSPDFFGLRHRRSGDEDSRSFEQPSIIGTASMNGASVAALMGNDRWQISTFARCWRFNANQAQIESFTGTLGGGHLTISGGALLDGIDVTGSL